MLRTIILLFALAVISGIFGFGGMAASFSWAAQLLTVVFAVLAIAALIFDTTNSAGRTI